jgi:hypothetical protein
MKCLSVFATVEAEDTRCMRDDIYRINPSRSSGLNADVEMAMRSLNCGVAVGTSSRAHRFQAVHP